MKKSYALKSFVALLSVAAIISCASNQNSVETAKEQAPVNRVVYGPAGKIIYNDIAVVSKADATQTELQIEKQAAQPTIISAQVASSKVPVKSNRETKTKHKKTSLSEFVALNRFKNNNFDEISVAIDLMSSTDKISDDKTQDDTDTLLYVLLSVLIPFGCVLAMYLYEGDEWTQRVTTNLILTLLCFVPGIIHALVIILGKK